VTGRGARADGPGESRAARPGLFGEEGERALAEHHTWLVPAAARPAFLRLLWVALLLLGVTAAVIATIIAGGLK